MSVQHPELQKWETRLKAVFDGIDDVLEEQYGARYPLHPARQSAGLLPIGSRMGFSISERRTVLDMAVSRGRAMWWMCGWLH